MSKYILKRLASTVITLWVVVTITFFLMRLMPGGPFDGEKKIPPQIKANLEQKFGMDKPVFDQYVIYLKNLCKLDLGPSMRYEGRTVNEIITDFFPASAKIGIVSIIFSLTIGVYMGITAALHQGKWQDSICMVVATLGITIPGFVIATLFIYFFALRLGWFNAIGLSSLKDYILPALALGGGSLAFIARLSRSSLLDVIRQDYITVAKAKGMGRRVVIYKHALRNSLIPIVTYVGPLIAGVLTGSFVIEGLFGIPGLGREFVTSIGNRDYTTLLGVVAFYSTFLIMCNLLVDILYAVIDPRIKIQG